MGFKVKFHLLTSSKCLIAPMLKTSLVVVVAVGSFIFIAISVVRAPSRNTDSTVQVMCTQKSLTTCITPLRVVHSNCRHGGGQAAEGTVVGTRGQQEQHMLVLGNNWSGLALWAGLMGTATVPYQLYQQHQHSYTLTWGWHWG